MLLKYKKPEKFISLPEMNLRKNSAYRTNQSVETRQNSCNASLSVSRRKDLIQPTYTFEVKGNQSTPLVEILEKLANANHHFSNLTFTANQQKEHLTAVDAKASQQE